MKIKHNGITLRVRQREPHERIEDGDLYQNLDNYSDKFWLSLCPGDKVSSHPKRAYFKVLSKFYKK